MLIVLNENLLLINSNLFYYLLTVCREINYKLLKTEIQSNEYSQKWEIPF
jgi:hypothetical protein